MRILVGDRWLDGFLDETVMYRDIYARVLAGTGGETTREIRATAELTLRLDAEATVGARGTLGFGRDQDAARSAGTR
ncbi:hypothetical protein FAIPA1_20231 [Frankia sp. AiPs1]|uniref:hypothetical protein n=1 Tax=Frankia sp. AiPa1 TaxID=573492 RepID=UPI00202ACA06|nr:hypothetical protein [Frankia sp. AiPa1]MCL9759245.1 hypothetical protein [Frankia sp. AiPa1]